MSTLTSQTTFNVLAAPEVYEEEIDLFLLPDNEGSDALRELHYPGDLLPPLVYGDNPDKWENFDSEPLTARPQVKSEMAMEGSQINQWPGYLPDRPVREYWQGSDNSSRMTLEFLRRLYEYFANPPQTVGQYITWWPKDRTASGYNVVIESLQVGGADMTSFMMAAHRNDVAAYEIVLTLRIISEVGD